MHPSYNSQRPGTADPAPLLADPLFREIRNRFDDAEVARVYAQRKNMPSRRNQREWTCIVRALRGVPSGAEVLDLPCGSGRLEPLLAAKGFRVTAADYSRHMIAQATAAYFERAPRGPLPGQVRFVRQDVMQTDFPDEAFEAVVCNRLLHHYPTSELRKRALREMARVTKRVLVISYFSSFAISALKFQLENRLRGRILSDRVPIPYTELKRDLDEVGLRCTGLFPVRYGLSPQTYLRLEK